jgi:hypothetical protein
MGEVFLAVQPASLSKIVLAFNLHVGWCQFGAWMPQSQLGRQNPREKKASEKELWPSLHQGGRQIHFCNCWSILRTFSGRGGMSSAKIVPSLRLVDVECRFAFPVWQGTKPRQ